MRCWPSIVDRRSSFHFGRMKPATAAAPLNPSSFTPSPSLSSRSAPLRTSRNSSRPRWSREKKSGSTPRPLAGVRARLRLSTPPSRGRMVVPCCHDRACEVQCGSLLYPARRSGATPRSPFHAVAMPPAVGKAQVGSLSLGLGLGSIVSESNTLFIHFSFAFDSENPRSTP